MAVTILGCGVAGSWVAHHLASAGEKHFVLFDGGVPDEQLLKMGPVMVREGESTKAELLANHLRKISPDVDVNAHAKFDLARHRTQLKGAVLGTMNVLADCRGSGIELQRSAHKWVTVGLTSARNGKSYVGSDPKQLREEHFGPTTCSKGEIVELTAQAARLLLS